MAQTAAPQQGAPLKVLGSVDAAGVGYFCEADSLESSDDEADNQLPYPDAENEPASDEASRQVFANNRKLREMHKRLEQRKKNFQNLLKAYQRKEMEFVAQMDSHMDEVEHTEHALSLRIDALSAENHALRTFNEKRERDNSQLAKDLSQTTQQCTESETRVQFLVDRIVALLSSGSADQALTDAVVSMRQREREMLRQLDETRQQFDEVRQQNGELHSRLTEELGLSRRLQEQLAEVEERFSAMQHQRGTDYAGFAGADSQAGGGLPAGLNAVLPSTSGLGEVTMPLRAGRLGPRPMGLRSDQTEAPPERERQPLREDRELPPPISEVGEALDPQMDGQSTTLGPVMEGDLLQNSEDESGAWATEDQHAANQQSGGDGGDSGGNFDYSTNVAEGYPDQYVASAENELLAGSSEDSSPLTRVQQGARNLPTIWPAGSRASPRLATSAKAAPAPAPEKVQYSRTTSSEGVLMMEQKLREALDRASFECAVVRIENGLYNFGPNVCAVVELAADNEVVACQQDAVPAKWTPIDEFIRSIAQRPTALQLQGASSTPNVAQPTAAAAVAPASSQDAALERRQYGPPAKAAQPYPAGSPPTLGTPVTLSSGPSAVSSVSPRRVASTIPSGVASAQPPSVAVARQAGTTPERVRMPGQPSPPPGYQGGQMLRAAELSSSSAQVASAPQSGSQAARVLVQPSSGPAVRYGVATVSPARQMPTAGPPVFQQGASSPRC